MSSLPQAIDEASALQDLAFRKSVFARQVNMDSFLALGKNEGSFHIKLIQSQPFLSCYGTN